MVIITGPVKNKNNNFLITAPEHLRKLKSNYMMQNLHIKTS